MKIHLGRKLGLEELDVMIGLPPHPFVLAGRDFRQTGPQSTRVFKRFVCLGVQKIGLAMARLIGDSRPSDQS